MIALIQISVAADCSCLALDPYRLQSCNVAVMLMCSCPLRYYKLQAQQNSKANMQHSFALPYSAYNSFCTLTAKTCIYLAYTQATTYPFAEATNLI
jgi:hypothetical protein